MEGNISDSITTTRQGLKRCTHTLAMKRTREDDGHAHSESNKMSFITHIKELNNSFHTWFRGRVQLGAGANLSSGVQDYIDYASQLENRYFRRYGECLTFGSGDCAQLGHGTDHDEDLMVKYPRIVYPLRDKKVCGISCGGLHNAVWTEHGHCYTWGCSDDGSLGRVGDETTPLVVQALLDANEFIIGVACGDGQTIVVGTTGNVWGWGCYKDKEGKKFFNPSPSASNQMKDIKKQQNEPLLIQGLSNAVEVACGSAFNLALCDDGTVYSWGLGECGELGRPVNPLKKTVVNEEEAQYDLDGIYKQHITPGRMYYSLTSMSSSTNNDNKSLVEHVKSIGCGAYHSLIVCIGGQIMACGLNNYSQLGK